MTEIFFQRRLILTTVLLFAGHSFLFAQYDKGNNFVRNTFFIELASKRPGYSVNYDHIFHRGEKLSGSFRIGFSIDKNTVSLPFGINLLTGKENHHAEFGVTIIPFIDHYKTFLSGDNLSDKKINVIPAIGYRFQKPSGGIFFKVSVSPLLFLDPPSDDFWNMDPRLYAYGSIGIGFSF